MPNRKTISVPKDAWKEAKANKGDRSWAEIIVAGAKIDSRDDEGRAERQAVPDDILSEDHIPDIGAEVERRFERALENARR